MALVVPYTLITQGLYSGIISGISTMTFGMCGMIKSIYNHKNPDVDNFIKKLDIEYRIEMISTILKKYAKYKTIDMKEHVGDKSVIFTVLENSAYLIKDSGMDNSLILYNSKKSEQYQNNIIDPLQISLIYLSRIIRDIHNDLIIINKQIEYHSSKWFNSWRTLNIKKYLDELETHNTILINRFNDFIKISSVIEHK